MRRGGALAGVAGIVVLAGACGQAGLVHRVRAGETLTLIGRTYGVTAAELARVNGIDDPDRIHAGQALRIPQAGPRARVRLAALGRSRGDQPAPFAWPVDGARLASGFGVRGDARHDGIDLAAPEGTPVRAARAGRVVFSAVRRGYGNVVVVDHGGGWTTLYAHNRENHVRVGDLVGPDAVIATLGATGRATAPNLHFEVRYDDVPYDPLAYLPAEAGVRDAFTRRSGDPDS